MKTITPEDFEIILNLIQWDNPASVHRAQAIAADDPTLTNLYTKYEEQNSINRRSDSV